jgi:hypothetical protein
VSDKKLAAAEELIRARDNARELGRVGKVTRADAIRVREADKAYRDAKK